MLDILVAQAAHLDFANNDANKAVKGWRMHLDFEGENPVQQHMDMILADPLVQDEPMLPLIANMYSSYEGVEFIDQGSPADKPGEMMRTLWNENPAYAKVYQIATDLSGPDGIPADQQMTVAQFRLFIQRMRFRVPDMSVDPTDIMQRLEKNDSPVILSTRGLVDNQLLPNTIKNKIARRGYLIGDVRQLIEHPDILAAIARERSVGDESIAKLRELAHLASFANPIEYAPEDEPFMKRVAEDMENDARATLLEGYTTPPLKPAIFLAGIMGIKTTAQYLEFITSEDWEGILRDRFEAESQEGGAYEYILPRHLKGLIQDIRDIKDGADWIL